MAPLDTDPDTDPVDDSKDEKEAPAPAADSDASPDDDGTDEEKAFDVEAFAKQTEQKTDQFERTVADLNRSVGRIQSTLDKQTNATSSSTEQQETQQKADQLTHQQWSATADVLRALMSGTDQDAIPAETRQRVNTALAQIDQNLQESERTLQTNERKNFVRTVVVDVRKELPAPEASDAERTAQSEELVRTVETEIRAYGLDPDDTALFDWTQANTLLNREGVAAMQGYIRTQIRAGLNAESADTRRQTKKTAGGKSPNGTGPGKSKEDKFAAGEMDLKDGVDYLRELGLPV